MKHFLRIAALLALFAFSYNAEAANRFAVCTVACTWDGSSTAMWSTTTGGTTGASVPGSSDIAIFDAATCVGGVTCTITVNTNASLAGLTTGACTASTTGCILDFSANNNSPTFANSNWDNSGTGTRTINCGSGTFSFTGTNANTGMVWTTTTNLTLSCASATFAFSGASTSQRSITFGNTALTYPTITIAANTSGGPYSVVGTNITAITAMTITAPQTMTFGGGQTFPITTITCASGSTSALTYFGSSSFVTSTTITTANAISCPWSIVRGITFAGGGSATFANSFDALRNSISGGGTLSITQPSSGGGSRGVIGG